MGWSYEQQQRLQKEQDIVSKYFPSFSFVNVASQLCLEGWMRTNSGSNYKLRLYVPNDLPYSVPDVVITYPSPIRDFNSNDLVTIGSSSSMHLLNPRDNCPKICTYRATNWNSNITFYKVLVKVRIWLEALDGHKRTGKSLDYFLTHQS